MRKLTISVSDEFYDGLRQHVGGRGMGRFVEEVVQSHLTPVDREAEYRAMAADETRERLVREWADAGLNGTLPDDDWSWLRDAERRGLVGGV